MRPGFNLFIASFFLIFFWQNAVSRTGNIAEIEIKNYSNRNIANLELSICRNITHVNHPIAVLEKYSLSIPYNCDEGIKYLINFSDGTSVQGEGGYLGIYDTFVNIYVEKEAVNICTKIKP